MRPCHLRACGTRVRRSGAGGVVALERHDIGAEFVDPLLEFRDIPSGQRRSRAADVGGRLLHLQRGPGSARIPVAAVPGSGIPESPSLPYNYTAGRDEHLRSNDFFGAGDHPQLIFRSTRLEHLPGPTFRVHTTPRHDFRSLPHFR